MMGITKQALLACQWENMADFPSWAVMRERYIDFIKLIMSFIH